MGGVGVSADSTGTGTGTVVVEGYVTCSKPQNVLKWRSTCDSSLQFAVRGDPGGGGVKPIEKSNEEAEIETERRGKAMQMQAKEKSVVAL